MRTTKKALTMAFQRHSYEYIQCLFMPKLDMSTAIFFRDNFASPCGFADVRFCDELKEAKCTLLPLLSFLQVRYCNNKVTIGSIFTPTYPSLWNMEPAGI